MFRLIRIDNAKNELLPDPDAINYIKEQKEKKVKMISIIGDARTGKSSFLNLMISKISGQNQKIFDTGDSLNDHCTFGISIYHCGDYLFLDCQGLNYQHNIHDTKMMLIAYMLSNVFILNVNMINNIALKLLEPILLFGKYFNFDNIDQNKKPILVFRIKDYSFDDDPVIALTQTMTMRNDNYDPTRNMIKILFSDNIIATQSEPLSRKYLNTIKKGEYLNIINDLDTFGMCIDSILNINCQNINCQMNVLNNDFAEYIKNLCQTITLIESQTSDNIDAKYHIEIKKITDEADELYKSFNKYPDGSQDYYLNTIYEQMKLYESIIEKLKTYYTNTQYTNTQYTNTLLDEIKNIYESYHIEAAKTNYKLACEFTESAFIKFFDNMIEYMHMLYVDDAKILVDMVNQRMQCLDCCRKENNWWKTEYGIVFDFDKIIKYKLNHGCKEHYNDLINKYIKIKDDINDMEKSFISAIKAYDNNVISDYTYLIKKAKQYISTSLNKIITLYYEKIVELSENIAIHAIHILKYIDDILTTYDMEQHHKYIQTSIYEFNIPSYPVILSSDVADSGLCIKMIKDIYKDGIKLSVSYNDQSFIKNANSCLREYIRKYTHITFHQPLFCVKWESRTINKFNIKKTNIIFDDNSFVDVACDFSISPFCRNIQSIFCSRLIESTENDKKDNVFAFGKVLFGNQYNGVVSFRQKYIDMLRRNTKYMSEYFRKEGKTSLMSYIKSGNNEYVKIIRVNFQVIGPISTRLFPFLRDFFHRNMNQLDIIYAVNEWVIVYDKIIRTVFPMLTISIFDKFMRNINNLPTIEFIVADHCDDNEIFKLAKYMENVLFEEYTKDITQ